MSQTFYDHGNYNLWVALQSDPELAMRQRPRRDPPNAKRTEVLEALKQAPPHPVETEKEQTAAQDEYLARFGI